MKRFFTKQNLMNNLGRIIYGFLVLILAILLIVFSAVISNSYSSNDIDLSQILENWEEYPIFNLYQPYSDSTQCNQGDESIFLYQWPGTSAGCQCNDSTFTTNLCCGVSGNSGSCCNGTPIQQINSEALRYWDMSLDASQPNPQIICGEKLFGYNFRTNARYNNECPSNLKTCGSDSNFVFCVPYEKECPIQEVRFEIQEFEDKTYENFQLNIQQNTYFIYIKRTYQSKLPIVQFRVSNHLSACQDEQLSYIPQLDSIFDLRSTNCSLSKQYFYTDLSLLEEDYFSIHNISNQLLSLPSFSFNTNYPFRLLSESYYTTQQQCLQYMESFYSINSKMNSISTAAYVTFILCLIYGLELLVIETWIGFIYNKYLWGLIFMRKKVNLIWKIIYSIKFILFVACITSSFVLAYLYNKEYNFFQNQISESCFDGEANYQFQLQINNMYPGLITGLIIVIFILFFIEPNVWYILITCYNPGQYEKVSHNSLVSTEQLDDKKGSQDLMITNPSKQIQYPIDYQITNNEQAIEQKQNNNQNQVLNNEIPQNQVHIIPNVPLQQQQQQQIQQQQQYLSQQQFYQFQYGFKQIQQNGQQQFVQQNLMPNGEYNLPQQNYQNNNPSQNISIYQTNRQFISSNDVQIQMQNIYQNQENLQRQQRNIEEEYETQPKPGV
ncbi:transmembrane protein, putative (macronuclear) [Tetrahymena thermophila SB210]|uniref:Transmembrane protein, putative n=1 Tax=Tetrahymena thermophila (strain SB210) TaxID=312017 RepID=Q24GS5_TETTS|nr:transmembrane protein, putative [Tetrahymena thermophila SB210]EAS06985.3 transmembrane protein, putative [Tetrahymena thermophila SB210]|eukprot:XP_001027227.3 transmembrane protein, putative [Tetrahymena thermophila SB210]